MPTFNGLRRPAVGALASLVVGLGFTAALVQPATAANATPKAVTKYRQVSEEGDYIGQGQTLSYTPATATITVSGTASDAHLSVSAGTDRWNVELAAPQGETLHPGVYRNAERAPFRTGRSPGLDVEGNGRGCNQVFGQFSVNQIETDPSTGAVTLLDATYTQHCESTTAPALKGVVKYLAYPLSYAYTSDAGDYVGAGDKATYTGATSTFSLSPYGDGVSYAVSGKRDDWSATLTPPTGEQFEVGRTYKAERFEGAGVAGLDVDGDGRGCNAVSGELTVTKWGRAADGTVNALAATFVQHCEAGEPALRGTIHYYA